MMSAAKGDLFFSSFVQATKQNYLKLNSMTHTCTISKLVWLECSLSPSPCMPTPGKAAANLREMIISLFHHFLSVINTKIKLQHSINKAISKYGHWKWTTWCFQYGGRFRFSHICSCLITATWQRKTHRFLWPFLPPKLFPPVSVLLKSRHIINATSGLFLITAVDHQKLDFFKIFVFKLICGKRGDRVWNCHLIEFHHEKVCKATKIIKNAAFNSLCTIWVSSLQHGIWP